MNTTPNDINNTLLIGPIDTEKEIKLILHLLQKESHLRRNITELEINNFLESLKQMRLDGPVDTPREIEIFLGMMRKSNMLMGPIDTPEEVNIFIKNLRAQGFMPQSIGKMNQIPLVASMATLKKRKKHVDMDEDEDNTPHP